jgi:regulator of protease activity HflC (stomatin/prohibitin superfamily)
LSLKLSPLKPKNPLKLPPLKEPSEEAITRRSELKEDFDNALSTRLEKYGILVLDTSVVDLNFSPEFASGRSKINKSQNNAPKEPFISPKKQNNRPRSTKLIALKGKLQAQRLLAETLKEQGGGLVLQKEAMEAWRKGEAQMPKGFSHGWSGKK